MKWFTHDNDLSRTPQMQFVIAELGMAGYGQALIMLEVLSRETENDGRFQFQLPLTKTTDLRFWVRELHASNVLDVEHAFDVFEQASLITSWRETQIISAPMLGERVDHWTKRKNRKREAVNEHEDENKNEYQHQHNYREAAEQLRSNSVAEHPTTVEQPSTPVERPSKSSVVGGDVIEIVNPTGENSLSDSEIMGLYTTTMLDTTGEQLAATKRHCQAAVKFFRKYGRESAMDSWRAYLQNYPQNVTVYSSGETKKERRKWPLQHFIDSGAAEDYANDPAEDYAAELAEARAAGRAAPAGTFD